MSYLNRIIDNELQRKLNASGAVLIRGAKSCGKTESAKQVAGSILQVDHNEQVAELMATAPKRLLLGKTPRLIDEWQEQPKLWQYIRHEVDERKQKAQFILTGSANPEESVKMHSGAGRFTTVNMRTMTWQEMGFSSGKISMKNLLEGANIDIVDEPTELEFMVEKIIIGGFPTLLGAKIAEAMDLNRAYIELLAEMDMSRVSNIKRDPMKVRNLLRSLARNTATIVDVTTLAADINENENNDLSKPTIFEYLDALNQLMITEEQPAWNIHIRSSSSLRKSPKRHFTDVSLAVAALGADQNALLDNLKFTGFLFESLATHELRVYAQANDALVYYYRDSSGLEVDAIVQKYNGDWAAFEIKLGTGQFEEAALNLKKLVKVLDEEKIKPPKSLNIITGTGISYTRADGINVISLASLGA
ncbi:ATPase AAA [Bacteroidia bacterium]|nr:ATPase AAA [Bacteroidia bacterium]GHT80347.1 ATPase AAA [Bacteroidia bacterium]